MNLKTDVENMAPKFQMPEEMEARFGRRALGLERTGVSHFKLAPNFRIPFGHRHETQEEVYVVVAGSGRLKVEDEILELGPLDAVAVPGGSMRNWEAGPDGVEYVAFGEAAGNDESDMVPGWWSGD
jgi:uncharacterized cupin superfamily protein